MTGPGDPPAAPVPARTACAVWRAGRKKSVTAADLQVLLVRDAEGWRWPGAEVGRGAVLGAGDDAAPPTAAVHAVREQAGVPVVAGVPLLDGVWAATAWSPKARLRPGKGVTEAAWCDVEEARDRLGAGDAVLTRLLEAAEGGRLHTRAVLVVRHCHARPRDAWNRADAERPLISRGRREAAALVDLLQCWRPERLVSSPWLRCRQTLEPFQARTGAKIRWKGGLSESGHRRDPGKAAGHLRKLLTADEGTGLLCTHRPVLTTVMTTLAKACADDDVRGRVPAGDPWLEAAEVLVAHVVAPGPRTTPGRPRVGSVVAIERHRPAAS